MCRRRAPPRVGSVERSRGRKHKRSTEMAENMTGMLVEGTMVVGTEKRFGKGRGQRFGMYGLAAAILVAMLIAGAALHDRWASHPAAPAISRTVTSQQTRFLENNTTNLPNAVT